VTLNNNSIPIKWADMIKLVIIQYIGGTDETGNFYAGLGMGEDVVQGRIASIVFGIAGVTDTSVTLSTDGITYAAANVVINGIEAAQTTHDKLVITIG
jgi:hypothetical protein